MVTVLISFFSEGKIKYIEKSEKVIYHAKTRKMEEKRAKSKTCGVKQNFKIHSAEEFIAAIAYFKKKILAVMADCRSCYGSLLMNLNLSSMIPANCHCERRVTISCTSQQIVAVAKAPSQ